MVQFIEHLEKTGAELPPVRCVPGHCRTVNFRSLTGGHKQSFVPRRFIIPVRTYAVECSKPRSSVIYHLTTHTPDESGNYSKSVGL